MQIPCYLVLRILSLSVSPITWRQHVFYCFLLQITAKTIKNAVHYYANERSRGCNFFTTLYANTHRVYAHTHIHARNHLQSVVQTNKNISCAYKKCTSTPRVNGKQNENRTKEGKKSKSKINRKQTSCHRNNLQTFYSSFQTVMT